MEVSEFEIEDVDWFIIDSVCAIAHFTCGACSNLLNAND